MEDPSNTSSPVWMTLEASNFTAFSSEETYLDQYTAEFSHPLGPQRDPLYIVVPITVIYLLTFLTGVVGNISTCVVIARNKSMHTATNYYLFSLAISDLLLLLAGLPAEIYLVWSKYPYIFGELFCKLRGLAAETSTNASVLTITAFTIERYVAICHPFLSQTLSKLSRVVKLNLSIWLIAFSCAVPQALQFGIVHFAEGAENVLCTIKTVIIQHSFELSSLLFFVMPMTLITILYALIGLKLRKSNMMKRNNHRNAGFRGKVNSSDKSRHWRQGRSSKRVLKMLVAVVICFFLCWAPFHVQRLIAIYGHSTEERRSGINLLYHFLTYISGVLYYISTTINPILYNIMSHKFREAFMETFAKNCRVPGFGSQRQQRSYSSLSRSQQRTTGTFGSRTAGINTGNAVAQESTENSGNSLKDESPRGTVSTSGRNEQETSNCDACLADRKHRTEDRCVSGQLNHAPPFSDVKSVIKTETPRNEEKKWWRVLDWLPGIKTLRELRNPREGEENAVLENRARDDFSISLCTFKENHRPV